MTSGVFALPELTVAQWALGVFCAFATGVAKTGVPGLGILVVPLMVLTVGDAKLAAGWLLPILCSADAMAVFYWRRHTAANKLFSLLPWVIAGMVGGTLALYLHEAVLRRIVGAIIFTMLALYLLRRFRPNALAAGAHGPTYGVTAGFATTVANAAGPVMNLYLLSHRLEKNEFVATGAWFFFLINLSKLPIYGWHGMISRESLWFDLALVPAVVVGSLTGRTAIRVMPEKVFEIAVVVLTALSTILLLR